LACSVSFDIEEAPDNFQLVD